jgi:hypothetical protein
LKLLLGKSCQYEKTAAQIARHHYDDCPISSPLYLAI